MEEKDDLFRQVKIMILKDFLKKKKGWVRYGIVSLLCWRNKKKTNKALSTLIVLTGGLFPLQELRDDTTQILPSLLKRTLTSHLVSLF